MPAGQREAEEKKKATFSQLYLIGGFANNYLINSLTGLAMSGGTE